MITERPPITFSIPTRIPTEFQKALTLPAHSLPQQTSGSTFSQVLQSIGHETHQGEALMQRVIHGGGSSEISSTEMLALQAGVYRYVELIDLTSKLVDRATQGVKTVMQSSGGG